MDAAESKNAEEILQTVLSVQKLEDVEVSELSSWQENEGLQRQEQVIWQIETNEGNRPSVLETNNPRILHHLPVTYVTANNQNIVFSKSRKPVTYILSQNTNENQKLQKIDKNADVFLQDPQKVVVVESKIENSDASYGNMGEMTVNYMDAKVYKVDSCGRAPMYYTMQDEEAGKSVSEYQIVEEQMERHVNEREITEIIDSDEVDEQEMKIIEDDILGDEDMKDQGKDENHESYPTNHGEEILVDDVKNSLLPVSTVTKTVKSKVEKKILTRKKKLKKRNVKSKLKAAKKIDKSEKTSRNETSADSSDDKKEKTKMKAKRNLDELTKLEERAEQVAERFKIGCECVDYNCFEGLNPEKVFRHRLNIADLTKAEHDMYLMGVIMTSMQNPDETCRHKERLRIRSTYVYQGKRVCLTAFLYLEHVTLYQMKRLRKHLKYHGVSPRIHGNRGRKPANTLSLDTYQHATLFVQRYIENHYVKSVPNFTKFSSNKLGTPFVSGTNLNVHEVKKSGKEPYTIKILNKMNSYHLPPDCTKKTLHDEYKAFCEGIRPDNKIMQYSTFTSFLKKQFPNVKFQKMDKKQEEKTAGEGKVTGTPSERDRNKPKMKKSKKVNDRNSEDGTKKPQTGKVFIPGRTIQIAPTVSVSSKQNQQTLIAKGQVIGNPAVKPPQIVINGQHMQICSTQNQSDVRLGEHFLVGNQIVNVSHSPAYAQRVYTMHNISNI